MTTLPEANAKFAIDCYQSIRKEHPCENLLFAPVNATSALGLLALGSGCEQAAEIEKEFITLLTFRHAPIIDLRREPPGGMADGAIKGERFCFRHGSILVLHWDEVKECVGTRNRRYIGAVRSFGRSATKLKAQQQAQQRSATCPKARPRPAQVCSEPCPRPRPRPEPTCPTERPCPDRCVPDYECETPEGVHTAFSKILATLNAPSTNYTLSFANKLYGDHDVAFIQKFIYCALKLYWSEVANADLKNSPEEVRRIINLWVEIQTHGKIKNLLPKDSFDCLAQLLKVNALYFKGQWQVKFDKELTVEAPFYPHYADQRDCYTVQLMNRKGVYNTGTIDFCDTEVQVLEVPYKDNELSFFILLPTDCSPEALEQLEDGLSHEHLLDLSCYLKPEEVDVFIPKFSAEKSYYLSEYLDLHDLSDPEKADFSQATTTEGVALTQLVHDAFIEIDEEGGEEPEARRCPRDRRPRREALEFVADHPFVYFTRHNCTQSIIALGRFAKPQ